MDTVKWDHFMFLSNIHLVETTKENELLFMRTFKFLNILSKFILGLDLEDDALTAHPFKFDSVIQGLHI